MEGSEHGANGKFVLPKELLNRINECSFGGFVLFCFNEEGDPEVYSMVDDNVNAMALQYYVMNWSKSLDLANLENSKRQILEVPEEDDDNLENGEI